MSEAGEQTDPLAAKLDHVRVVLVRTFHPGNIGSAARAMKTMGLSELVLVDPWRFPDPEAEQLAAGAGDLLEGARVVPDLASAVADCTVVAACSARPRQYDRPVLTPRESAAKLLADPGPVALVFGPERYGLRNEHIELATHRVCIEANPAYPSLNLAAAVQLLCHELRCCGAQIAARSADPAPAESVAEHPTSRALDHFYDHLDRTFSATGFVNAAHPGELQRRLRRLFARAEPDRTELNILEGMLASIDKALDRHR